MIPKSIKPQTPEDVASLVGAVALAVLAVIIVTALYLGREVFVPVALAILLSFVLAPPVAFLQRLRVPRAIAVVGVVLFAFAIIFALGSLIATQLNRLAGDLPRYQTTIQSKIQSVRGVTGGSSTLERAAGMLQDLGKELDKPKAGAPSGAPNAVLVSPDGSKAVTPVPVEVLQPDPGALGESEVADRASGVAACDHRHHRHLRDLHSDAARRPSKPADPAGGLA